MSKYRPLLKIRTDLADSSEGAELTLGYSVFDDIASRLDKYSITPKTLKAITEFHPDFIAKSEYNPELYTSIEEYSHGDNKVLRYSINTMAIDTSKGSIFGEGKVIDQGTSISATKYKKSNAKAVVLHSIEKHILIKALDSFYSSSAAGQTIKTAVVDIFERNDGASINRDISNHPIIHSIVLQYIKNENLVCVIDPTNFKYSNHLENDDFSKILSSKGLPLIKTHTVVNAIKLYTPVNAIGTGYNFNQYRDCIDIAVKVAFALNKNPISSFDEYDNESLIKSNPAFIVISNQPNIDSSILYQYQIPMRIKQTSSLECQKAFSELQFVLNTKKEIFNKFSNDKLKMWFMDTFKKIITLEDTNKKILDDLFKFNIDCNEKINDELINFIGVINE